MVRRLHPYRSAFALIVVFILALFPVHASAQSGNVVPVLEEFIVEVMNGKADELRGLYIPGVLADVVVSQPDGELTYVSPQKDAVTQFVLASRYDSIGLLAHNYLAGGDFFLLEAGQEIHLVYGDGRIETYVIRQFMRYQALIPESTISDFVDLETGEYLSSSQLFLKIFNRPGDVVLQTCIYAEGEASWGRLFIVAEPHKEHEPISMPVFLEFQ